MPHCVLPGALMGAIRTPVISRRAASISVARRHQVDGPPWCTDRAGRLDARVVAAVRLHEAETLRARGGSSGSGHRTSDVWVPEARMDMSSWHGQSQTSAHMTWIPWSQGVVPTGRSSARSANVRIGPTSLQGASAESAITGPRLPRSRTARRLTVET